MYCVMFDHVVDNCGQRQHIVWKARAAQTNTYIDACKREISMSLASNTYEVMGKNQYTHSNQSELS